MMNKRERKLGENRCQCASCGLYFNSAYAFDKHRTGDYGASRRCMSETEMKSAGMAINAAGWWISAVNPGTGMPIAGGLRGELARFGMSDMLG